MPDQRRSGNRRIWKHRLRQCENVSISLVTKNGKAILEIIVRSELEVLSIVVFEILLSGVLHNAVDEDSSVEEMEDVLVTVEAPPALLGRTGQFEHHRQARSSSATPLGPAMA